MLTNVLLASPAIFSSPFSAPYQFYPLALPVTWRHEVLVPPKTMGCLVVFDKFFLTASSFTNQRYLHPQLSDFKITWCLVLSFEFNVIMLGWHSQPLLLALNLLSKFSTLPSDPKSNHRVVEVLEISWVIYQSVEFILSLLRFWCYWLPRICWKR